MKPVRCYHQQVFIELNLYSGWSTGSIANFIYSATESGWFDLDIFHMWFRKCFVPFVYRAVPDGSKLLFGDNVASHFDMETL